MRHLCALLVLFIPLLGVSLLGRTAEASSIAGGGLAYGSEINQPGLNLGCFVELGDTPFRTGAQTTVFFPREEEDPTGFDQRDFLLSTQLNFQWRFFQRDPAFLYLTSGLHFDFIRSRFRFDDPTRESESESDFGLGAAFGAGADIDIGFSGLYVEANAVAVSGGFSQLVVAAGLRFWLG